MHALNDSILYGALAARKQGVRVVLSIQGYGDNCKNFSDAAKTEASGEEEFPAEDCSESVKAIEKENRKMNMESEMFL